MGKDQHVELRALIVEDSDDDAELLLRELGRTFHVTYERVATEASMARALEQAEWDIVLADYSLPSFGGLQALSVLKSRELDLPCIIVSGSIDEETAVGALRAGARDFILKGRLARLAPAIDRELREARVRVRLREAEQQLLHAQKMEAVGRIAGGLTHDFNNVLSVITLSAELLAAELPESDPKRADVDEIQKAAARASELTRHLLAFSRGQVLQPTIVDLAQLVRGMETMVRRVVGASVALSIDIRKPLGLVVVDPGQIEQVVLNLVVNARDAMPDGGALSIRLENLTLDADDPVTHPGVAAGRYTVLSVTDTGIGIDATTRTRIFEPFFTTKPVGRGTGLGLSTAFGIVKQSGGHIGVTSAPGKGSTFTIYLPHTTKRENELEAAPAQTRPPAEAARRRGNETVLLVDDDQSVRTVVRTVLSREGYRVLEAPSGNIALALCEQKDLNIDLLLTDLVMPKMSGRQLASRARELRPRLSVVFMSGYADEGVFREELDVAFIQKPLTPELLIGTIRQALAARSP